MFLFFVLLCFTFVLQTRRNNPDGRVLIFVDRQELADELFRRLMEKGHLCRSLHGGMDQDDRDDALTDFKKGICNILVATSIVARGLDVRQLHLVINYEVPNHYEDYVHRCGRTGRAGNKGEAYTFITEEQDKFAVDIVKALELSHQDVPKRLKDLAEEFNRKVKEGTALKRWTSRSRTPVCAKRARTVGPNSTRTRTRRRHCTRACSLTAPRPATRSTPCWRQHRPRRDRPQRSWAAQSWAWAVVWPRLRRPQSLRCCRPRPRRRGARQRSCASDSRYCFRFTSCLFILFYF